MIQPGDEPIPGYRVEKLLGRGQYGEVWRTTSPGRSSIALKFLDMTGRQGWKEFRAAQRVKQIRHVHLMPIVALWLLDKDGQVLTDDAIDSLVGEDSDSTKTISFKTASESEPAARMVIATLLGDLSLKDRLRECRASGERGIPFNELIGYMQEAAKGIDYLNSVQHEWAGCQVGVQHCDIKPDNIMLVGGSVVICDFGVAQVFADDTPDLRATSLSGSPAYMAPEAFEGRPGRGSDQYSLAITYYELRTGRLPLDTSNFATAYEAHRTGKLDFSQVPKHEQIALRRATNVDSDCRFDTTADFVEGLRTVPAGNASRKKVFAGVMAMLILAASSAILVFILMNRKPTTSRVTLHFDAPRAHVVVNGNDYVADAQGLLAVDVDFGAPLILAAIGNDNRRDEQWTITADELAKSETFEFSIPFAAAYYAEQAENSLENGNLEDAVAHYAVAVKQAPDVYARLPEPAIRAGAGIIWGDCVRVTPAEDQLIVGSKDGVVRSWKISSSGLSEEAEIVYQHKGAPIVSLAISRSLVASADDLGSVWIQRAGNAEQLVAGNGTDAKLAITGGGNWLVAAVSKDFKTQLIAWDVSPAELSKSRLTIGEQPGEFPRMVGCAEDSVVLATKDKDALVWRWNITQLEHEALGQQQNDVLCLAVSSDGKTLVYTGAADSTEEAPTGAVIELGTNKSYPLGAGQADSILSCALSADGRKLATSERMGRFSDYGSVLVSRPVAAGELTSTERVLEFDRNLGDVTALVFSPQAEWLAAGHERGAVSIWRLSDAKVTPYVSFGKGDRVVALCATGDKRWLLSGARDGRIMVFDLRRLEMLHRACQESGVSPQLGQDRVTFLDRSAVPERRSLSENGGTVFPAGDRPTAIRAG